MCKVILILRGEGEFKLNSHKKKLSSKSPALLGLKNVKIWKTSGKYHIIKYNVQQQNNGVLPKFCIVRSVTVKFANEVSSNKPPIVRQKSRRCKGSAFTNNNLESTLMPSGLNNKSNTWLRFMCVIVLEST